MNDNQAAAVSGWSRCNLGDALLAEPQLAAVKAAFNDSYEAAARPAGMAVFIRHESAGRLHCEVVLYFSPAAAPIAAAFGAVPCARPSTADLGLLAGSGLANG